MTPIELIFNTSFFFYHGLQLSLLIGAGVIGLFLTVLQYVQDDSKVQEILQDFFEINTADIPGFQEEIQNIQAILEKRTNGECLLMCTLFYRISKGVRKGMCR